MSVSGPEVEMLVALVDDQAAASTYRKRAIDRAIDRAIPPTAPTIESGIGPSPSNPLFERGPRAKWVGR